MVRVETSTGNIAGVTIPVFEQALFEEKTPDLIGTPPWVDDGMRAQKQIAQFRVQKEILDEDRRLLSEELRITNQRDVRQSFTIEVLSPAAWCSC